MKGIFAYLSPYKLRIALGLFFKAAGTVAELALPLIMSYMIDDVAPAGNALALGLWGGVMLLAAVIALLGNVRANRMASRSRGTRPNASAPTCFARPFRSPRGRRTG